MFTIGVNQSLCNSTMYQQTFLVKIKRLYKSDGKLDNQQQYKAILEASIVLNDEGGTDNSPISPSQFLTVKNPSARK